MHIHINHFTAGESRLIFLQGPEQSREAPKTNDKPTKVPPTESAQFTPDAKQARMDRKEKHIEEENRDRNTYLPELEKRIQDEQKEQEERAAETPEAFFKGARETLPTEDHKEVFDVAINALSPEEKAALHKAGVVLVASFQKHTKFNISQSSYDSIRRQVFAECVVRSSIKNNYEKGPAAFEEHIEKVTTDAELELSAQEKQLIDQADQKILSATQQFLAAPEHNEIRDRIQSEANKRDEEVNAWLKDKSERGAQRVVDKYCNSPQEDNQLAAKELPALIKTVNGVGIEMQPNDDGQKVTLVLKAKNKAQVEPLMTLLKDKGQKPEEEKQLLKASVIRIKDIEPAKAKILIASIKQQTDEKQAIRKESATEKKT